MIHIVNGDLQKVKEEIKQRRREASIAHAKLVKKYTARGLQYQQLTAEERAVRIRHAHYQEWYTVGTHLPVKLLGYVVDYRTLKPFMQKLRGFQVTAKVVPGAIVITYTKRLPKGVDSGVLKLHDLTQHYEDLKHIPTAELEGVDIEGVTV